MISSCSYRAQETNDPARAINISLLRSRGEGFLFYSLSTATLTRFRSGFPCGGCGSWR